MQGYHSGVVQTIEYIILLILLIFCVKVRRQVVKVNGTVPVLVALSYSSYSLKGSNRRQAVVTSQLKIL